MPDFITEQTLHKKQGTFANAKGGINTQRGG